MKACPITEVKMLRLINLPAGLYLLKYSAVPDIAIVVEKGNTAMIS